MVFLIFFADYTGQDLQGKTFIHWNFYMANFTRANLTKAYLTHAKLKGADFTKATLTQTHCWLTNFTGAVFNEANLNYAHLHNANFTSAKLNYAILSHADLQYADLTNAVLTNVNLEGANLTGVTLTGVKSGGIIGTPKALPPGYKITNGYLIGPGVDVTNMSFAGMYLEGANLTGMNLEGVDLRATNFGNANLTNANLTRANMSNTGLSRVNLTGATLTNANLNGASFVGNIVNSANMTGVKSGGIIGTPHSLPSGVKLVNGYIVAPGVNLSGIDLRNANLEGVNLSGANLTLMNLSGANLTDANLEGADLQALWKNGPKGTAFYGANLTGANLTRAKLVNANMYGAILEMANLYGANLSGANLEGANLMATDLRETTIVSNKGRANMTAANLEGADLFNVTWSYNGVGPYAPGANFTNADMRTGKFMGGDFSSIVNNAGRRFPAVFSRALMVGAYFSNSNMRYAYMYPFDYAGWRHTRWNEEKWGPLAVPKYAKYGFPYKYKDAERNWRRALFDHDFTYYVPRWPWDPDPDAEGNDWEIAHAKFHYVDFRYANLRIAARNDDNDPVGIPYLAKSGNRFYDYDAYFYHARMDDADTNYDEDGDDSGPNSTLNTIGKWTVRVIAMKYG